MATILTDDFNSYNDGNLIGQGSWGQVESYGGGTVQGTVVKEGAKAVQVVTNSDVSTCNAKDGGTAVSPGSLAVYFRITAHASWESDGYVIIARIGESAAWNAKVQIIAYYDGYIKYLNSGATYTNIVAFSDDQWYCLQIEWKGSGASSEVRYRIDDGSWTEWVAPYLDWTTGLRWWGFGSGHDLNNNPAYIDYIAEEPITAFIPKVIIT